MLCSETSTRKTPPGTVDPYALFACSCKHTAMSRSTVIMHMSTFVSAAGGGRLLGILIHPVLCRLVKGFLV